MQLSKIAKVIYSLLVILECLVCIPNLSLHFIHNYNFLRSNKSGFIKYSQNRNNVKLLPTVRDGQTF